MILEYINRKKQPHYIKVVLTNTGKERYYIIKDIKKAKASDLLTDLPKGFEFYEFPADARVVLRKIIKSTVSYEEYTILTDVMKQHETVKDFIIDKEKDALMIYQAWHNKEEWIADGLPVDNFDLIQHYNDVLRFEKDKDNFKAQRFCNLSRYYGWITMETSNDLEYLAEKFCYHIDKESLLEFWIEGEEDW